MRFPTHNTEEMTEAVSQPFSEIIEKLPTIRPVDGVTIHVSSSDTHEVMFLRCDVDLEYPAHAHSGQWTVVLSGQIDVTIDGETTSYTAGERYEVPPGVEHSVFMHAGYAEVFLVDEPDVLGLRAG